MDTEKIKLSHPLFVKYMIDFSHWNRQIITHFAEQINPYKKYPFNKEYIFFNLDGKQLNNRLIANIDELINECLKQKYNWD